MVFPLLNGINLIWNGWWKVRSVKDVRAFWYSQNNTYCNYAVHRVHTAWELECPFFIALNLLSCFQSTRFWVVLVLLLIKYSVLLNWSVFRVTHSIDIMLFMDYIGNCIISRSWSFPYHAYLKIVGFVKFGSTFSILHLGKSLSGLETMNFPYKWLDKVRNERS